MAWLAQQLPFTRPSSQEEELGKGGVLVCPGPSLMLKEPGARMHKLSSDAACGKLFYHLHISK